jgi:SAM-dependent methyltransferase
MLVSAAEGYRLWAPHYDAELNPLVALERRAMTGFLRGLRPANVVDVACGTGYWMRHWEQAGANVFGCDACCEMLPASGKRVAANAEALPFADRIADLVICSLSLGYFHQLQTVFAEIARILRPGGCLALSDMHPESLRTGWKRSFRLGVQVFEMHHFVRELHEVEHHAAKAGLSLERKQDVCFGMQEFPIFEKRSKADSFIAVTRLPALFLALWRRPC